MEAALVLVLGTCFTLGTASKDLIARRSVEASSSFTLASLIERGHGGGPLLLTGKMRS